jgi:hypothetical protein
MTTVVSADDHRVAPITGIGFDYNKVSPATAETLRRTVSLIHTIQRSAIVDLGKHLDTAKRLLEHGAFSAWAEAELKMTLRTAERYIMTARFLDGKPDTMSLLPSTILYALAAPSTPANLVEEVVAEAEAGALPTPHEIKSRLTSASEAKAEAAKSAEQKARERKAKGSKSRQAAREAAEWQAYQEGQEREEQERADRLRPLAGRIAQGSDLTAIMSALEWLHDGRTLLRLLREIAQ